MCEKRLEQIEPDLKRLLEAASEASDLLSSWTIRTQEEDDCIRDLNQTTHEIRRKLGWIINQEKSDSER